MQETIALVMQGSSQEHQYKACLLRVSSRTRKERELRDTSSWGSCDRKEDELREEWLDCRWWGMKIGASAVQVPSVPLSCGKLPSGSVTVRHLLKGECSHYGGRITFPEAPLMYS